MAKAALAESTANNHKEQLPGKPAAKKKEKKKKTEKKTKKKQDWSLNHHRRRAGPVAWSAAG
jgi:hypothetical protein